jgi:hypothetical protein
MGLSSEDVLNDPGDPRLLPVLRGLASLGDRYYHSGTLGAAYAPLRYRHGMLLFGSIYRELGWRAARGEPVPRSFAEIPIAVKAGQLGALLVNAWHPRTLGWVRPPPHDRELHRALVGCRGADR